MAPSSAPRAARVLVGSQEKADYSASGERLYSEQREDRAVCRCIFLCESFYLAVRRRPHTHKRSDEGVGGSNSQPCPPVLALIRPG